MGHYKIFQVSKTPLLKSEYIIPSDFYDYNGFMGVIADWVKYVEPNDEQEIILGKFSKDGLEYTPDKRCFKITDKDILLSGYYDEFVKTLKRLSEYPKDKFINHDYDMDTDVFSIDDFYHNRYSDYIYDEDDGGLQPFVDFIRYHDVGEVFFIGGIVDYHH